MKISMALILLKKQFSTAYVDDTTCFIKDKKSVIELMKVFDIFSTFSGLKPDESKCRIPGLGAERG